MSDKPQRRWFQYHLSTAVVLMLIAVGFVYLNTRPPVVLGTTAEGDGTTMVWIRFSGFPFSCVGGTLGKFEDTSVRARQLELNKIVATKLFLYSGPRDFYLANGITAVLVLFFCGVIFEWWIRRKERLKDMQYLDIPPK